VAASLSISRDNASALVSWWVSSGEPVDTFLAIPRAAGILVRLSGRAVPVTVEKTQTPKY